MISEPPHKIAGKAPDAPFDPFRPDMPHIPGLGGLRPTVSAQATGPDFERVAKIGAVILAVLVVCIAIVWGIKSVPRRAADSGAAQTLSSHAGATSAPLAVPAVTPAVAATVEELDKPWTAKKFVFVKPVTRENVDALVIRIPGNTLWAFALREPFGRCQLEFVKDTARIAKEYGYRATHPMVVNPCSRTVFDPMEIGSLGGGVWVRGEIVHGGDFRPPISIHLRSVGHSIIADRIE